jgi:hypothetical protein
VVSDFTISSRNKLFDHHVNLFREDVVHTINSVAAGKERSLWDTGQFVLNTCIVPSPKVIAPIVYSCDTCVEKEDESEGNMIGGNRGGMER